MFFYTQSSKKRCVFFDQRFRTVHGMVSSYLYKLPAALRTETVSFMHETLRLNNPGHLHSCLPLQKNVIYLYSMGADSCSSIIKVPRNVVSFLINAFVHVHGMVSSSLYKLPAALRTETVSFMHETLRLNNPGHLHSCLPLQTNVIYLYSMGADSCSSIIKVPRNVVSFLINAFVQSMEWFRALYINFLQCCGPKRFRSCMKLFAFNPGIHVFHYRQL